MIGVNKSRMLYPWFQYKHYLWLRVVHPRPSTIDPWQYCIAIIDSLTKRAMLTIYESEYGVNIKNVSTYASLDEAKCKADELLKSYGWNLVDEKHLVLL